MLLTTKVSVADVAEIIFVDLELNDQWAPDFKLALNFAANHVPCPPWPKSMGSLSRNVAERLLKPSRGGGHEAKRVSRR